MKTIKICDKEYPVDCNAYTYVQFKKIFGTGIFEAVQKVQIFLQKQIVIKDAIMKDDPDISQDKLEVIISNQMIDDIDDFFNSITKLAYILIYTVNEEMLEYEKWLKTIDKMSIDDDWIVEVTELAVEKFCR